MEMDDDFDSSFEHGKAVGWNARRAAMLQVPIDHKTNRKIFRKIFQPHSLSR
jgi:hypothetical protein